MNQSYPGEFHELANILDGLRQEVAHACGTEALELFITIDNALKSSDLERCRRAIAMAACWQDNRTPDAIKAMKVAIQAERITSHLELAKLLDGYADAIEKADARRAWEARWLADLLNLTVGSPLEPSRPMGVPISDKEVR